MRGRVTKAWPKPEEKASSGSDGEGLIGAREGDEGLAEAGGEGFVGEFEEQVGDGGALLGGVRFMFHSAPSVARGRADGRVNSL